MTRNATTKKFGSFLLCVLLLFSLFAMTAPGVRASNPAPTPGGGSLTAQSYSVKDVNGNDLQTISPNQAFNITLTLLDSRITNVTLPNTVDMQQNLPTVTVGSAAKFSTPGKDNIIVNSSPKDMTKNPSVTGWTFTVELKGITYLGGDNNLILEVNYPPNVAGLAPLQTISVPINHCRDNPPAGEKPSGDVAVLGYVTQTGTGQEIQLLQPNQKCQIVVKLSDGRLNAIPPTDAGGQMINIKLTTTTAFTTPTMGDITVSSPRVVNGALEYAVVFNDIMYQGGENKLSFDLSYPGTTIPMQNVSVGISQCRDPKLEPGAKPLLMVQEIGYGAESIRAGDTFALTLTSKNISKTQALTDIITTITLPAGVVLASGSNAVLSPGVAAGGTYAVTYTLQALASAETGPANITVGYTFYPKGSSEQGTSSQTITVPIVQPDRFSFTAMEAPTELYVGEENTLTVNFVNKGKGLLYNFSAEISGNIAMPGQSQYLGNIASGATGSVDFSLQADAPGTVAGTVTIIYEDVNGKEKRQTHEYSVKAIDAPAIDDPGMFPVEPEMPVEQGGMPWWAWALIFGGGLGGVGITVGVVKKARAKKRAKLLEEEDASDEDF